MYISGTSLRDICLVGVLFCFADKAALIASSRELLEYLNCTQKVKCQAFKAMGTQGDWSKEGRRKLKYIFMAGETDTYW